MHDYFVYFVDAVVDFVKNRRVRFLDTDTTLLLGISRVQFLSSLSPVYAGTTLFSMTGFTQP